MLVLGSLLWGKEFPCWFGLTWIILHPYPSGNTFLLVKTHHGVSSLRTLRPRWIGLQPSLEESTGQLLPAPKGCCQACQLQQKIPDPIPRKFRILQLKNVDTSCMYATSHKEHIRIRCYRAKNSLAVPQQVTYRVTMWPAIPPVGIHQGKWNHVHTGTCTQVQQHSSQPKGEKSHMANNWWMDK